MAVDASVSAIMQPSGGDICIDISAMMRNKLAELPSSPSEYCIFRVHNQLRNENEVAYEPEIISIGPYHRGKEKLKVMEEYKLLYLQSLLQRRREDVDIYVNELRPLEEEARKCYAELPKMKSEEFIEMLLLDGCFIVELFRKVHMPSLRDKKDPIFVLNWMKNTLQRDLMLFENQIPFFVPYRLFNLTEEPNQRKDFIKLAINFFCGLLPGVGLMEKRPTDWPSRTKHLLGIIHDNWLPPFAGKALDARRRVQNLKLIHSVSELRESGVKFEKADENSCLLDIKFRNGTMHIPCITMDDRTECFLRNLIAYEEYNQDIRFSHIICYTKFLDCLLGSTKDVEILRRYGIIKNWLGDDESVSGIFSKLSRTVTAPRQYFHYSDIFNEVNAHCDKRVNRWKASFRRRYLSSPWAFFSILGAITLLLLALIQTIFSAHFHT